MSRSASPSLSAGATGPEALSLLQQRLLDAEQEAEALIRETSSLGVSRHRILQLQEGADSRRQQPMSPHTIHEALQGPESEGFLLRQCDSLVSRVCRLESLLQTLKLIALRMETEKELDPSHTAHLKEELVALQKESEEEQQASRREVMRLREQLRHVCKERKEACLEVQRLGDALEEAATAKMDISMAAEELKSVTVQMTGKLVEMQQQVNQETSRSTEAERSRIELLRRIEEMEKEGVRGDRQQLQAQPGDCQTCADLRYEAQAVKRRVQEEQERANRLQDHCQELTHSADTKDSLVSEMKTELESMRLSLQKRDVENNKLQREAADKIQTSNDQLEDQCSQLNSALYSLKMEKAKQQSEHEEERSRVFIHMQKQDSQVEADRCKVQAELQAALSDKARLQLELEKLQASHSQPLLSSVTTEAPQRERVERTVESAWRGRKGLKSEMDITMIAEELMKGRRMESASPEEVERSHSELLRRVEEMQRMVDEERGQLNTVVTKLDGERNILESQLREAKNDAEYLCLALHRQQEENRRLMGKMDSLGQQQNGQPCVDQTLKELTDSKNKLAYEKGKLLTKVDELQEEMKTLRQTRATSSSPNETDKPCAPDPWRTASGPVKIASNTTLENILASSSKLQLDTESLQQELAMLRKQKVQSQREMEEQRTQAETLQELLTSTQSKNEKAVKSLRKNLETAKMDKKRLERSLEQAMLSNSTLQTKLEQNTLSNNALQNKVEKANSSNEALQTKLEKANSSNETLQTKLEKVSSTNNTLQTKLEKVASSSNTVQSSLEQIANEHQATISQREEELRQAKTKICHLTEDLEFLKHHVDRDNELSRVVLQKEVSELKKSLEDSSTKSRNLSKSNWELQQRVAELEEHESKQRIHIRDQEIQMSRTTLSHSQKLKAVETQMKNLAVLKNEYQKKNNEQTQLIERFRNESQALQRELERLTSIHEGALGAERELLSNLHDKCQGLEENIRKLQERKDEAYKTLRDSRTETLQISTNLEDANKWFKSRFEIPKERGMVPGREASDEWGPSPEDSTDSLSPGDYHSKDLRNRKCEWERGNTDIQRETTRELANTFSMTATPNRHRKTYSTTRGHKSTGRH